jgi:small-conductance mechanosensitive channel
LVKLDNEIKLVNTRTREYINNLKEQRKQKKELSAKEKNMPQKDLLKLRLDKAKELRSIHDKIKQDYQKVNNEYKNLLNEIADLKSKLKHVDRAEDVEKKIDEINYTLANEMKLKPAME